jgi:ABC-type phosphate transport system substrate-binding protein
VQLSQRRGDVSSAIYQNWMLTYNQQHPDMKLNYQSIGSGGGSGGSPTARSTSAHRRPDERFGHHRDQRQRPAHPTVMGAVAVDL